MDPFALLITKDLFTQNTKNLCFKSVRRGRFKELSGFIKGVHFVPKTWSPSVDSFLYKIGEGDLKALGDDCVDIVREVFSLKHDDYEYSVSPGSIVFSSEICGIELMLKPDRSNLQYCVWETRVTPGGALFFSAMDVVLTQMGGFDEVEFHFEAPFDIENIVRVVEEKLDKGRVDYYYPPDASSLRIDFHHDGRSIEIDSVGARYYFAGTPDLISFIGQFC